MAAPASPQLEFISIYNNELQPLSIELEVGGSYKTANSGDSITITSISNNSITYKPSAGGAENSATGHVFFTLLEPGIKITRTFQGSGSGKIYTMTSDVKTDPDLGTAVAAANAAARGSANAKLTKVPGPAAKSVAPTAATADSGKDVERKEDTLYGKMELARKANIAYSKGVNIAVTLTIPGQGMGMDKKYKFQILECKPADSLNGKYHYNVWASEHAFNQQLGLVFQTIFEKNKTGKGNYYRQEPGVGIHRWFQITKVDFDRLISAKNITKVTPDKNKANGIQGWKITQYIDNDTKPERFVLVDNGTWVVDDISRPIMGFKDGDPLREEGGNKSQPDDADATAAVAANNAIVVNAGIYKVSPTPLAAPAVNDDKALTSVFDFYVEKDYVPMDGSWQCVACYLVTIRPKPKSSTDPDQTVRTQFPAHLKDFFSANLKPSNEIDAGKIGASLTAALTKKSVEKVAPRRRWWLTNTGGLQFILPASEYATWVRARAGSTLGDSWQWELPATAGTPAVVIPGKWQTTITSPLDVAVNVTAGEGRDKTVYGECTFGSETCSFIMFAPTDAKPFSLVLVKLNPPPPPPSSPPSSPPKSGYSLQKRKTRMDIIQGSISPVPAPSPAVPTSPYKMSLQQWLTSKKDSTFVAGIKLKIELVNFFTVKEPDVFPNETIAVGGNANLSKPPVNNCIRFFISSTNSVDDGGGNKTVFFPTVTPDPTTDGAIQQAINDGKTPMPNHVPVAGGEEYRIVLNGDISFRIVKSQLAHEKYWAIDTVCEDADKLKAAGPKLKTGDIVTIKVWHKLNPNPTATPAIDGYNELITNVRPSPFEITGPHQYSKPYENSCWDGAVSMAFSITSNDYRKMLDNLLSKTKVNNWELPDAHNIITNSTWTRAKNVSDAEIDKVIKECNLH